MTDVIGIELRERFGLRNTERLTDFRTAHVEPASVRG
jgi:hypothetical protein